MAIKIKPLQVAPVLAVPVHLLLALAVVLALVHPVQLAVHQATPPLAAILAAVEALKAPRVAPPPLQALELPPRAVQLGLAVVVHPLAAAPVGKRAVILAGATFLPSVKTHHQSSVPSFTKLGSLVVH